jgi:hypothetical protein
LTGIEPRRTGGDTWRAPAVDGDNQNRISGDDSRGVWHDFRDNIGAGVLDLVVKVRGGNRADALHWCADLAGVPLEDTPLSAADRARWAQERRRLEQELPEARLWRRAAIEMSEQLLDVLKRAFFGGPSERIDFDGIRDTTRLLARLQRIDGAELVAEFHSWMKSHPRLTSAMVQAARRRETAARRALVNFLRLGNPERCAA